jgi:hypothetical protein
VTCLLRNKRNVKTKNTSITGTRNKREQTLRDKNPWNKVNGALQ